MQYKIVRELVLLYMLLGLGLAPIAIQQASKLSAKCHAHGLQVHCHD